MTGTIVTKMPANSLATSSIGAQLKSLPARAARGVSASDSKRDADQRDVAHAHSATPRACRTRRTSHAGFQSPLISTSAITAASSTKLILPSMPSGARIGRRIEKARALFFTPMKVVRVERIETRPAARRRRTASAARDARWSRRNSTPLQKAEKERRIAQRRQRAAHVRHEEDEEHHHMDRRACDCRWRAAADGSAASPRRSCP